MATKTLSPGKYRALQRATTAEGHFAVVALDHQDALKRSMRPDAPDSVSENDLRDFKLDAVRALISDASGVLLDPIYGAFPAVASNVLGNKGLLIELEKADYQMAPLPLDVEIDPDWNVTKIKRMNADGVKLFFYYNPDRADHAARQESTIRQVVADCARYDIPLYAEPILFTHDGDTSIAKTELVAKSARRVAGLGADVLKLEFPVDVNCAADEAAWLDACKAVTESIDVPWALLSASVSFDVFARHLEAACRAGASGYIVGRALWGEAALIANRDERLAWLKDTGSRRLQQLNTIVAAHGAPWFKHYVAPPVTVESFRRYASPEAVSHD